MAALLGQDAQASPAISVPTLQGNGHLPFIGFGIYPFNGETIELRSFSTSTHVCAWMCGVPRTCARKGLSVSGSDAVGSVWQMCRTDLPCDPAQPLSPELWLSHVPKSLLQPEGTAGSNGIERTLQPGGASHITQCYSVCLRSPDCHLSTPFSITATQPQTLPIIVTPLLPTLLLNLFVAQIWLDG